MCLMEGKLEKLNGDFWHTVQKAVRAKQAEQPDFVPTHITVTLDAALTLPGAVEVFLANQDKTILPVYGSRTARDGYVCICRPEREN